MSEQKYELTAARVLEQAWDDGNASGLDGWVGPGRGAGYVDAEAERSRAREVARGEADLERLLAQRDERVRAEERAKRLDREQLDRAEHAIGSAHQFLRDQCLCGFKSSRSRWRTEHITGAVVAAVLSSLALDGDAPEVTDAEQYMLRISASWDAAGKHPLPNFVGPFPSQEAAFHWVRHQAPLSGSYNSTLWPVRPEEVRRG